MWRPQATHTQLLINTLDWGIEESALDRAAAKERGLVKWKRRWVTREERARLKGELNAYNSLRALGLLAMLGGLASIGAAIEGHALVWRVYAAVQGTAVLTAGVQILNYRSWARWLLLGAMCVDLAMLCAGVLLWKQPILFPALKGVFVVLFAYYLFGANARIIFGPPAESVPASSPTDQGVPT